MGLRRSLAVVVALVVALTAAPSATGGQAPRRIELARLTYLDGTQRQGSDPRIVRLGFDAARSAEVVGADIPGVHTPQLIATGEGPDHLQSVTVDVHKRGDLAVVMTPGNHPSYPTPVRGTASGNGAVRRGEARWEINNARPDSYTFSVQFRARVLDPNLGSYLPEARITLNDGGTKRTLVFEQHTAPAYGSPRITAGKIFGSSRSPALPDEWVAHPEWVARGAYHWATGRVSEARDHRFRNFAPGATGALNAGSMGWASSGIPKVVPVADFLYSGRSARDFAMRGFRVGATTADLLGDFPPFTTDPNNGRIYEGDGATLAISMSAGSAHWNRKARPTNNDGELRWDWDGAWAEGWATGDAFDAPGIRGTSDPIHMIETALHAGAFGGDIDNRGNKEAVKGPRWHMDIPNVPIGFVGWGMSVPPGSRFDARGRFMPDGRFVLRPVIGPGGYLVEAETNGYHRRWQPPVLIGGSFIGAQPSDPEGPQPPTVSRSFTFPPGVKGVIRVATTTGITKRFDVAPGIWQVTASMHEIALKRLALF